MAIPHAVIRDFLHTGEAEGDTTEEPPVSDKKALAFAAAWGGCYTYALAERLKNARPLHWVQAHPDDVATQNFLAGAGADSFRNLGTIDVVELASDLRGVSREVPAGLVRRQGGVAAAARRATKGAGGSGAGATASTPAGTAPRGKGGRSSCRPSPRSSAPPGVLLPVHACVKSVNPGWDGATILRRFFTKSFLGDDVAALAPSSGEEPTSPRHRRDTCSMAWRSTRRFSTNAPSHTGQSSSRRRRRSTRPSRNVEGRAQEESRDALSGGAGRTAGRAGRRASPILGRSTSSSSMEGNC